MLASQQKPIKQGWLLKKAGTGLIAPWRSKFVVITASRDTDGDHEILVYDQRDLSFAPKHKILLSECSIDVPKKTFSRLKKGAVPFAVFANSRKVNSSHLV